MNEEIYKSKMKPERTGSEEPVYGSLGTEDHVLLNTEEISQILT
jgi:hypothetical protein